MNVITRDIAIIEKPEEGDLFLDPSEMEYFILANLGNQLSSTGNNLYVAISLTDGHQWNGVYDSINEVVHGLVPVAEGTVLTLEVE